ncbi:hypothetical protein Mgra_00002049 [Meloidogyne graminicola]|uniref:DUF862 domain-containing protein n=1 Tax=Meloidogyne graminicola TaxID=189291 RepID=A0A8S9ZXN2_9BILA|nr:hypothetical protein Mgra_00002049 [Meloidogyne graminicola]
MCTVIDPLQKDASWVVIMMLIVNLISNSTNIGIFHVGVFVCEIEIHFHSPGIEYWIPKYFHTRFNGGHFKSYDNILIKNPKYKIRNAYTSLSFIEIVDLIDKNFIKNYTAKTYQVITNNCLKFAKKLIKTIYDKEEGDHFIWPNSVIFPLKKPLMNNNYKKYLKQNNNNI